MITIEQFFAGIIAIVMLWAAINWINRDREAEGKKPMGCIATLIVIVGIILFWGLLSKI